MKPQDQVCLLQQAKRLKELGIVQESALYHVPWKASDFDSVFICGKCDKGFFHQIDGWVETLSATKHYSAFTVAELGAMLPCRVRTEGRMYELTMHKADDTWHSPTANTKPHFWYQYDHLNAGSKIDVIGPRVNMEDSTEAVARAHTLIYLLENNRITPEECNARLTA
jgi:hypothetical protein